MSRQAVDTLWLTLARADGATTRMGVTSEHPLFVTGEGWVSAGELAPGDQIRDAAFRALTVLTVKWDPAPRIVNNLEIADAHTYFAGELEAWEHNSESTVNPFAGKKWCEIADMLPGQGCARVPGSRRTTKDGVPSEWLFPDGTELFLDDTGEHRPDIGDHVDVTPSGCGSSKKFRLRR